MTTRVEGHLAEELIIVTNVSNGDSFVSKLSSPLVATASIGNVGSGGTAQISATINPSNNRVTLNLHGNTPSGGTAYVSVKGRL